MTSLRYVESDPEIIAESEVLCERWLNEVTDEEREDIDVWEWMYAHSSDKGKKHMDERRRELEEAEARGELIG